MKKIVLSISIASIIGGVIGGIIGTIIPIAFVRRIEMGSIADWLSAFGSISATVVALYLATRRRAPELGFSVQSIDTDTGQAKLEVKVINSGGDTVFVVSEIETMWSKSSKTETYASGLAVAVGPYSNALLANIPVDVHEANSYSFNSGYLKLSIQGKDVKNEKNIAQSFSVSYEGRDCTVTEIQ